jgi:hypothetical protein
MAAFYMDENVTLGLAPALRQYGHGVTSTAEERRLGAPDPHQLHHAAGRGWIMITHNRRDFELLHIAWLLWTNEWNVPLQHAGILIVEQVRGQLLSELARLIHDFVDNRDATFTNTLHDWKPKTGWVRFR